MAGLFEVAKRQAQEMRQAQETQSAPAPLVKEQAEQREALTTAQEVYKRWQENSLLTRELRRELLQGVKEGRSYAELLLIAAKAFSLLTDNDLVYSQIAQEIDRRENSI